MANLSDYRLTQEEKTELKDVKKVRKPEIKSHSDGDSDVNPVFTIEGTSFSPLYSTDERDYREFQVKLSDNDWDESLEVDEQTDSDSLEVSLDPDTSHDIRIRDVSDKGDKSEWSETINITTSNIYVETPSNESPSDGETDVGETPTLEISSFSVANGDDTHINSQFRVFRVSDGEEIYDSGTIDDTTTHEVPSGNLSTDEEYEWQGRHEGETYGWSDWSSLTTFTTADEFVNDPLNGEDGQSTIQYGDNKKGFYGEVETSDLISGDDLASEIGLSAGTAYNDNEPWLKFAYQGSVIYVAKKPYRYELSFEDIYEAGAAYGSGDTGNEPHATWSELTWEGSPTETTQDAKVTIGGVDFDVRLLQGTDDEFSESQDTTDHNEWNQLIYAVHEDEDSEGWGVNYSDSDLCINDTCDGYRSWVQESPSDGSDNRVNRGHSGVTASITGTSDYDGSGYGWRPALVPSDS